MFARRKRGSQDEDEPLVPHGLVWQATDDEPGSSAETLLASHTVPAPPIQMPSDDNCEQAQAVPPTPVSHAPESIAKPPDSNPGKLGNISPPIRWPSLKTASVIRRIEPVPHASSLTESKPVREVTPPQKLAPVAQVPVQPKLEAQPTTLDGQGRSPSRIESKLTLEPTALKPLAPEKIRQVEVIELETTDGSPAEKSQRRDAFVRLFESLRHQAGNVYRLTGKSVDHAGRKLQTAYAAINLRARFERAKLLAEKCVHTAVAGSVSAREAFKARWATNSPRMDRVRSSVEEFSSNAMKSSIARSADFAQRVRNHRVRIRLVKSPSVQAVIQRSKLAWAARSDAIRREPRLWTSLAMGALSALLTLGLITAVRPYAPGRNLPNSASQSQHGPASLIAPQTALASTRQTAKAHRDNGAVQKPTPRPPSSVAASATPKPVGHRTSRDEEDYVAPNSYHYYGPSGKSR